MSQTPLAPKTLANNFKNSCQKLINPDVMPNDQIALRSYLPLSYEARFVNRNRMSLLGLFMNITSHGLFRSNF